LSPRSLPRRKPCLCITPWKYTPSATTKRHSRLGVQSTDLIGVDATPVRPEDAMARAAELLAQALSTTPEADRHLISAAVVVLDSIRRQLMR